MTKKAAVRCFELKRIKSLFVIGEEKIFGQLMKIVEIALETNTIITKMLEMNYAEKELDRLFKDVLSLEKKSDEIALKISEDITSGAINPNIIDNLLDSVQLADDIVDLYFYISKELNRMAKVYSAVSEIKHIKWETVNQEMIDLAEKSLVKLKRALSSSSISQILVFRKEIEALEEKGDSIKDTGFDRLYSLASQMHYLEFQHNSVLLHKCDDILDSCEDFSDLIVSVITSIVK
jgi:uncharacterized protein Yka (UPF0111/DUF47 family)